MNALQEHAHYGTEFHLTTQSGLQDNVSLVLHSEPTIFTKSVVSLHFEPFILFEKRPFWFHSDASLSHPVVKKNKQKNLRQNART